MIEIAVVVVLAILVLANVGLKLFNYLYPPCEKSRDYFESARILPDGAVASLASIPSGTDLHYVGARTVPTGIPGVIGLASRNPAVSSSPPPTPTENKKLFAMVDTMFPSKSGRENQVGTKTKTSRNGYDGVKSAIFETEMEGLRADSSHRNTDMRTVKPSGLMNRTSRDGYSDR